MKHHFYEKYEVNTHGRDFVVGDLHGCYTLFQAFLDYIKFDTSADRMYCVGDLFDRGPENMECMRLVDQDWFHHVYANHDELAMIGAKMGAMYIWVNNGGNWWYNLTIDEQHEVEDYLNYAQQYTPSLISVQKKDGSYFHVIHAELYDKSIPDDDYLWDHFNGMAQRRAGDGDSILWGRAIYLPMYGKHITEHEIPKLQRTLKYNKVDTQFGPTLGHVYSGHTIMRQPTTVYGQTNIDTGAYSSGRNDWAGLTFTEPETGKFWTVKMEVEPVIHEVQALVVA